MDKYVKKEELQKKVTGHAQKFLVFRKSWAQRVNLEYESQRGLCPQNLESLLYSYPGDPQDKHTWNGNVMKQQDNVTEREKLHIYEYNWIISKAGLDPINQNHNQTLSLELEAGTQISVTSSLSHDIKKALGDVSTNYSDDVVNRVQIIFLHQILMNKMKIDLNMLGMIIKHKILSKLDGRLIIT